MPLRTTQLEEPSINLTSMLDVVMLLIIFFMLSTTFSEEERQYDVKLPSISDATALTGQPDEIVVNVSADGEIVVRQKPVTIDELEAAMRGAAEKFAGQTVIIRGDGSVAYQHIMDVMAACRRGGIKNTSLAHRPKAGAQ
jgi:biopolymer transport protein ExbD